MNDTIIFDISDLRNKSLGTTIEYNFDGPVKFEDVKTKSNIKGLAEFMNIEEGILAKTKDLEVKIEFSCDKCLEKYTKTIKIPEAERIFYFQEPEQEMDPNEIYYVDMKKLKIDLSEMLRQEIILQFPLISVCSKQCKGICPNCGKNRNKVDCGCKIEEHKPEKNFPLAKLKDLIKK